MHKFFHKIRIGISGLSACVLLLGGCSGNSGTGQISPTISAPVDFSSYVEETFREYATSDSLSLHYTMETPGNFGITKPAVSLGHFSVKELQASVEAAKEKLATLQRFSKDTLAEEERLLYDLLEYAFTYSVLPEECLLYDSPLGPATGLQTQLPILLAEYRFSSLSDVEDYFLLLQDLPNYFSDLCAFERERSAAGTQSCSEVLRRIILQCEAFIENPGDNFLIAGFPDRLAVLPDLSTAKRAELSVENQRLVLTKVIPAYEQLVVTLRELCDETVSPKGLCDYPQGRSYYDLLVHSSTGTEKSPEELILWLEEQLQINLSAMASFYKQEGFAEQLVQYFKNGLSTDTPDAILSDLQTRLCNDFPKPAAVSCRVENVHASLEDFISPALYLVPPLDGYTDNVIYINQAKCTKESLFSTLAHEGYPGHLYQNTYFAANNPHPLRMLLNFTGYDEGWATYAECFAYRYADCSKELQEFLIAEQIAGLCLYSLSDLRIHYLGQDLQEIVAFLEKYGFSKENAEEVYYSQLAEPAIYLPYTVGYLEICRLRDLYLEIAGADASLLPFHTFFLTTGPAPFSLLQTKLEETFR